MPNLVSFRQFLKEETEEWLTIYRGESVHNRRGGPMGGKFFSVDREWARQFTQTGQDHEVIARKIKLSDVLDRSNTYAGEDFIPLIREAKAAGKKAVRLNEGSGEPDSVYVFVLGALR